MLRNADDVLWEFTAQAPGVAEGKRAEPRAQAGRFQAEEEGD